MDAKMREDWRFRALIKFRNWVMPSYRIEWPYLTWWNDAWFNAYLEKFSLTMSANTYRRWTLYQLAKLAAGIPGDTAECGAGEGSCSYLICSVLKRPHFMFDSFRGLSVPRSLDGNYHHEGDLSYSLNVARRNLADFADVHFLPGWIPERFHEVSDRRFCFVHIDVQLEQPTYDSLAFLYPRMTTGGVMVFDDYGYTTTPGARLAIDRFLADKTEKVIETSSGNGFLIRATH